MEFSTVVDYQFAHNAVSIPAVFDAGVFRCQVSFRQEGVF